MARVLVPLAPGFDEIEAITIIDLLRRAEIEVVVAGTDPGPIAGSHQIVIYPDTALDAVLDVTFDLVVLPGGGEGTANLRRDRRVIDLVQRQAAGGRYVAAICAAPTVLADAGLLAHTPVTSYPSYRPHFPSSQYREDRVVVSDRVITSRGPGTALEFSLALVELLAGPDQRQRLAEQVLAPGVDHAR